MLQFFKRLLRSFKEQPTIDSLEFPDFAWTLTQQGDDRKQWLGPEQTQSLTVNFFDSPPDLLTVKNATILRQSYRDRIAQAGGGIVQLDTVEGQQTPYVKMIFKFPQEPSGMTYLGTLIFPFKEYSYVVKIQAMEVGSTGTREAVIRNKLLTHGAIDKMESWESDPYDASFEGGCLMNLAEAEAYDAQFENHPLSQVRRALHLIEEQVQLKPILETVAPFED